MLSGWTGGSVRAARSSWRRSPALRACWPCAPRPAPSTPDVDRLVDEIVDEVELQQAACASGRHLPLLACRHIDFSYGQLQVLFDVDFTVDDGEMVALLGIERRRQVDAAPVVSGLGLPSARHGPLRGHRHHVPRRRAPRAARHLPGPGRARRVFGPLTVLENLRGFGYTPGRDRRRRRRRASSECFEAFPRLAERRNQTASTLSGGEQQMLGLSRRLLLQPRLLLIDELSLGLAPGGRRRAARRWCGASTPGARPSCSSSSR